MAVILVVHDSEAEIADIKTSLELGGHNVLIAKSVEAGELLLRATSFDLLICGVHLRDSTTVFDLLTFVKNDSDLRPIPFVLFCRSSTGFAKSMDETVRTTSMLLGADKYITHEDFNAEGFRAEIESLLPGSKPQTVHKT